jgi:hypothetical protein
MLTGRTDKAAIQNATYERISGVKSGGNAQNRVQFQNVTFAIVHLVDRLDNLSFIANTKFFLLRELFKGVSIVVLKHTIMFHIKNN